MRKVLGAFAGYGIEIEYTIVDRDTLTCRPIADRLLAQAAGQAVSEFEHGRMGWSNEMMMHVIEIKNPRPTTALSDLPAAFCKEVGHINDLLSAWNARLMPAAMHPWMDPRSETQLWTLDNADIYRTYERIFDVRDHGWANLQSMHVNLPFADDGEFARLHAAIRIALPIIPALAASSPVADGRNTGFADYRMEAYRTNADAFPSIAGHIIPETVASRAEYEEKILAPMYREIAATDPQRVLQHEWLNSRGAIARFDRNAIEIRVIDTQECPLADLAVAAAVTAAVRSLYEGGLAVQQAIATDALATIFSACIRDAEQAQIADAAYLRLLGFPASRCTAGQLWRHMISSMECDAVWQAPLQAILEQGPLARRLLRAIDGDFSRPRLTSVYRQLCDCLEQGSMFLH